MVETSPVNERTFQSCPCNILHRKCAPAKKSFEQARISTYHLFMRHICAVMNFRDLAVELGRQRTRISPEVCLQKARQKASRNLLRISRHFLETRGSPGKPGRLKDLERHGTQIYIGKFPPGKRDYLFRNSVYSGKFPVGRTKKSCSIHIPTGISGIFW